MHICKITETTDGEKSFSVLWEKNKRWPGDHAEEKRCQSSQFSIYTFIWWVDLYLVNRIVDVVRTDGWHGYWTMAHSASGHLPNYQTAESFKSSAHTLRCTIRAKLFPDTTIKLAHCLVIARTFKPIMLKRKTSARQDMRCGDIKTSHATINSLTILSQTLLVRTKARIFSY